MPVNCKVHLILDFGEKLLCRFRRPVIVKGRGIDVRDLLIKLSLRQPNLPDLFQLFLKVFLRQNSAAVLQPFLIHDPALNRVVLDDCIGPFTELHGPLIVYLEAHRNDCPQTVMIGIVSFPVGGSY